MRFRISAILFLLPVVASAQLTAPGSGAVRHTVFPGISVFIYCNTSGIQKGTLNAESTGGIPPYDFTWSKWSNSTKSFSIPVKTESGVTASVVNNLEEGGYRVNITNSGGYSESLTGWIFIDKPWSKAEFENNTCEYLALKGTAAADTFYYYGLDGSRIKLPNGVKFLWSSKPESKIPYPDFRLEMLTYDPPVEDVTYNLQVTDSFSCKNESTYFYESIHSKADIKADPMKGEAPLEVSFINSSLNASSYLWEFGDGKDSTSITESPGPHTYYKPGEYTVKLTAISAEGCQDSVRSEKIVVEQSEIHIPNVFTPDGDGYNDWFIPEKKSMRYISMEVFSQSGLKVYSYTAEGKDIKDWKGWDGNINSSSVKASPGVYFYLIRAYGWDDVNYDGKEYRGFVYLYR